MEPSSFSEFDLIQWIRSQCPESTPRLLGIGDDTAVVQPPSHAELLFATDMLMEGTHFEFPATTPERAGRKALAVNISDIAAMAGKPHSALVSLALPKSKGPDFAKAVMQGITNLAQQFQVRIIGGDTNSWDGPLVINVAIMGFAATSKSVKRSGAEPGDWVFVTGELGGSLEEHHLTFSPRVQEAIKLNQTVPIHAMIDVSDGLASDMLHILEESRVGVILDETAIPISHRVSKNESKMARLEHALSDGEDFELLFTVSPQDGKKLLTNNPLHIKLTQIGEITFRKTASIQHPDGSQTPLESSGWKHSL